jgi:hypothetical protein
MRPAAIIPRTLPRSLIQALLLAENLSKGSLNKSQGWPWGSALRVRARALWATCPVRNRENSRSSLDDLGLALLAIAKFVRGKGKAISEGMSDLGYLNGCGLWGLCSPVAEEPTEGSRG